MTAQPLIAGLAPLLMLCAAGCTTAPVPAGNATPAVAAGATAHLAGPDAPVSRNLDEYMTALADAGRFSGAVLVARGDTVRLSKGYGTADDEFGVPNTPTQIAVLVTAAFGLMAALVWNGAIQAIFKAVFGTTDTITGQLIYVVIVTIIAVIATIMIARSVAAVKGEA